jgi:hypothetical protein
MARPSNDLPEASAQQKQIAQTDQPTVSQRLNARSIGIGPSGVFAARKLSIVATLPAVSFIRSQPGRRVSGEAVLTPVLFLKGRLFYRRSAQLLSP